MGAAAGRSQRPQPLRRLGGRRRGNLAIQGAPRGSVAAALGPGRPLKTLLDPGDAQGQVTEPRDRDAGHTGRSPLRAPLEVASGSLGAPHSRAPAAAQG